jgi:hypothetical protein
MKEAVSGRREIGHIAKYQRFHVVLFRTVLCLMVVTLIAIGFASANSTDDVAYGRKSLNMSIAEGVAKMDQATKANIFHEVLKRRAAGESVDPALWNDFVSAQNDALRTGPKVGEKVPDFALTDQNGKEHSLQQLMGPKGLLLVFVRSADW